MSNIKEWSWYQSGISYNNRLEPSYYDVVDCNWDFLYGFQWRNADLNPEYPQPVFNNLQRFATFFVSAITANKIGVNFRDPLTAEEGDNSDSIVDATWKEFEERVKFQWQAKNALWDGIATGDYVGHVIMDADVKPYDGAYSDVIGQLDFELVDPNNFYLGNPNSSNIPSQPWIQVAGRDMVQNLKNEQTETNEMIQSDNDTNEQASKYGQIELEDIVSDDGKDTGKATYIITYVKKKDKEGNTKVYATKCTQDAYIYKDVETIFTCYPVSLGNWKRQRNTYHGMSFVRPAIPAQIFINRAFASAMKNVQDTAFSKFIYDKEAITKVSNRVATQTGVSLKPGQRIGDIAQFIAPGNMSAQVIQMIELANQYMRETIGANDALLGDINPEQASGVSIAATSKQAGIPLEEPKSNLYNWVEDIARIFYDGIRNGYGTRPVILETEDGAELVEFNYDTLQNGYKTVSVDVGPSSYWSELAIIQTLDNLLDRGLIEFIDYLERMPEGYIKDKQGLIDGLKAQVKDQEDIETEFVNSLTPEEQQEFFALPEEQQAAILQGGL